MSPRPTRSSRHSKTRTRLAKLTHSWIKDKSNLQVKIVRADVVGWKHESRVVFFDDRRSLVYDRLCIATGAVPRTLEPTSRPQVMQIRDTDTIERLQRRLADSRCRRIVLLGDGGIAMEIAYEVSLIFCSLCLKTVLCS